MKHQIKSLILILLLSFFSCSKGDNFDVDAVYASLSSPGKSMKEAIVTVKQEGGEVVMFLSDSDRAYPLNWYRENPSEPFRAMVEYEEVTYEKDPQRHYIYISWLEPIETGSILGSSTNKSSLAADPVEIIQDEFTSVEGGFLTIHYKINTSGRIPHSFSIYPSSVENAIDIMFIHDAHGDATTYSEEGIVAFPLDSLSKDSGKIVLKVSYRDFDNKLYSIQFEYGQ